jgi:hypothetical protein
LFSFYFSSLDPTLSYIPWISQVGCAFGELLNSSLTAGCLTLGGSLGHIIHDQEHSLNWAQEVLFRPRMTELISEVVVAEVEGGEEQTLRCCGVHLASLRVVPDVMVGAVMEVMILTEAMLSTEVVLLVVI